MQLRHGIIPLLDTVTYWSGAESILSGRPLQTSLAPSFSNFDAAEFLERDGRIPFVDFPIAYPLLAGVLGLVIGTRAAMHLLAVMAIGGIAATTVAGALVGMSQRTRALRDRVAKIAVISLFACLVPFLPAMRLVTQGTLSEPLFIAAILLLVVTLGKYRSGGRWGPVVVLVIATSLLRFLGAPLAVLAGWEYMRRTGNLRRSILWTVAMITPAGVNIVAAAANGGGHGAGWRGLDRLDVEVFVRSVGGWFDATQGDIRRTYFTTDGPSWWSWPLTAVVLGAMVIGVIGVVRRSRILGDTADIALAAAAILTAGLAAGILGFDALVIADNRLMLPTGILVTCAVAWTAIERAPSSWFSTAGVMCAVVVWAITAVRPWNVLERFSDVDRPLAISTVVADFDIDVVISNDADGVHWDTGIPAAYAPMSMKPLTGQIVDDVEIYRRLPCPLLRARGAIVISNETTFSTVNRDALEDLVEEGRLRVIKLDRGTVYLATDSACGA